MNKELIVQTLTCNQWGAKLNRKENQNVANCDYCGNEVILFEHTLSTNHKVLNCDYEINSLLKEIK